MSIFNTFRLNLSSGICESSTWVVNRTHMYRSQSVVSVLHRSTSLFTSKALRLSIASIQPRKRLGILFPNRRFQLSARTSYSWRILHYFQIYVRTLRFKPYNVSSLCASVIEGSFRLRSTMFDLCAIKALPLTRRLHYEEFFNYQFLDHPLLHLNVSFFTFRLEWLDNLWLFRKPTSQGTTFGASTGLFLLRATSLPRRLRGKVVLEIPMGTWRRCL